MERFIVHAVLVASCHSLVLLSNHSVLRNKTSDMSNFPDPEGMAGSEIVLKTSNTTKPTASSSKPYFGDFFFTVGVVYRSMHGYVSVVLCLSAMLCNTFNVVVLLR